MSETYFCIPWRYDQSVVHPVSSKVSNLGNQSFFYNFVRSYPLLSTFPFFVCFFLKIIFYLWSYGHVFWSPYIQTCGFIEFLLIFHNGLQGLFKCGIQHWSSNLKAPNLDIELNYSRLTISTQNLQSQDKRIKIRSCSN